MSRKRWMSLAGSFLVRGTIQTATTVVEEEIWIPNGEAKERSSAPQSELVRSLNDDETEIICGVFCETPARIDVEASARFNHAQIMSIPSFSDRAVL